jgi:hypothetical protein
MERMSRHDQSLLTRVEAHLKSEKARALFRDLVRAQERGGARQVKELVTRVLSEEKAMQAEDAEVVSGDGR